MRSHIGRLAAVTAASIASILLANGGATAGGRGVHVSWHGHQAHAVNGHFGGHGMRTSWGEGGPGRGQGAHPRHDWHGGRHPWHGVRMAPILAFPASNPAEQVGASSERYGAFSVPGFPRPSEGFDTGDGWVTHVRGIGSYVGGILADADRGNGLYLQRWGTDPERTVHETQRPTAKVIIVDSATTACHREAGVCVIRP